MDLPPILIVDDDPGIRDVLRYILEEQEGYTVFEAAEGTAGLAHLRATSDPTIVLLGIKMPGMDGREMLRRVAADATLATRHRYIIVTGALGFGADRADRDLLAPLDAPVVHAPFELDMLFGAVAQAREKLDEQAAG